MPVRDMRGQVIFQMQWLLSIYHIHGMVGPGRWRLVQPKSQTVFGIGRVMVTDSCKAQVTALYRAVPGIRVHKY